MSAETPLEYVEGILESLPKDHPEIPGLLRAAEVLRLPEFRGEPAPNPGPEEAKTQVANRAIEGALEQVERARRILTGEQFAPGYRPLSGRRDVLAQNVLASLPALPRDVYVALVAAHDACDEARTARFEADRPAPE